MKFRKPLQAEFTVYVKSSLGLVIVSLTLNLIGAKWMGDLHLRRINYAAENLKRWENLSDHPKPANSYHLKTGQREWRPGH